MEKGVLLHIHTNNYTFSLHNQVHPQVIGMPPSSRFALPVHPAGEEPIYVNAKQYHAILRRREHRAKLESQNKTPKIRKVWTCLKPSMML